MKQFLLLLLVAFCFQVNAQRPVKHEGPRAKTAQEYQEMVLNSNLKIARSHEDFVERVRSDKHLRMIFKDRQMLLAFLSGMKMTESQLLVSIDYSGLKAAYPKEYKEYTDYILGVFGIGELFDTKSSTSAEATHLDGYYCSCPNCWMKEGSTCIFSICESSCKRGIIDHPESHLQALTADYP